MPSLKTIGKSAVKVSEAAFTRQVVELLTACGWRVYHPLPAQHRNGRWATATQGHTGWPDIAAAHKQHGFIVAELKTATGRVSDNQKAWLHTLVCAGVEAYVWRPADIDVIRDRAQGIHPC